MQLPRSNCRGCGSFPNNLHAFPPSMEVSVGYYGCMDGIGRVETGAETESNAWSNYTAVIFTVIASRFLVWQSFSDGTVAYMRLPRTKRSQ